MIKSYKLQAPSSKHQAPSFKPPKAAATICHIDTRCRGATIESLTLEHESYIIVDMKKETITIHTMFGKEKELSKEEFVTRWTNWSTDFYNLDPKPEDYERFKSLVKDLAEKSFDQQLKEKQHG